MSLLILACAAGLATQAPAGSAGVEPVAHFRLGAAAATARVYHEAGLPRIEVIITNDTGGPVWWRGAGIGCVGFGTSWAPVDEDGREHPEFTGFGVGCTMEKDLPPTAQQLDEWRLDPGSSETVTLHPFWDAENDEEHPQRRALVRTFVRWVEEQEFTLPRAMPPPGTMDFDCPTVHFAWDRSLGLRVFVPQDGDVDLPHFDPFDETPFFRADPVPVHVGPLVGTARIVPDQSPPRIELTLRNPMPYPVAWSPTPPTTCLVSGFINDADPKNPSGLGSITGVFPADPDSVVLPFQSRTLTIAPFEVDAEVLEVPAGRWHFVQHSTWPVADRAPGDSWPAAVLHAVWDPRFGLTVNLSDRTDDFDAFRSADVSRRHAAVLRLGDAWLHARATDGRPQSASVELRPVDRPLFWIELDEDEAPLQTFHFRGEEVSKAVADPDPEAPIGPQPLTEEDLAHWSFRLDDSGTLDMDFDFSDLWSKHYFRGRGVPMPAWEWTCPVLIPQRRAPAHTADFERTSLILSWDPEVGLSLREESP